MDLAQTGGSVRKFAGAGNFGLAPERCLHSGRWAGLRARHFALPRGLKKPGEVASVNGTTVSVSAAKDRYTSAPLNLWRPRVTSDTGHKNWIDVNNDINSSDLLAYIVYNGRAFTGRIRFLGRK
jgi:hypothetical protein